MGTYPAPKALKNFFAIVRVGGCEYKFSARGCECKFRTETRVVNTGLNSPSRVRKVRLQHLGRGGSIEGFQDFWEPSILNGTESAILENNVDYSKFLPKYCTRNVLELHVKAVQTIPLSARYFGIFPHEGKGVRLQGFGLRGRKGDCKVSDGSPTGAFLVSSSMYRVLHIQKRMFET